MKRGGIGGRVGAAAGVARSTGGKWGAWGRKQAFAAVTNADVKDCGVGRGARAAAGVDKTLAMTARCRGAPAVTARCRRECARATAGGCEGRALGRGSGVGHLGA